MQEQRNSGGRDQRHAALVKTATPGVYKRGSRYVATWRHRGKQHKSFHPTLAEAREAKGKRQSGDRRPASREPFEQHARRWLASYAGRTSRGVSERTRALYLRDLERHAFPFFAGRRLADVEPADVREFVKHLEDGKGLAPATIRAALAPVKAMYADAFEDGHVRANPTRVRVRGRSGGDERPRALTRAELAAFLAELPDEWRLLFRFLAATGLRISELVGLRWQDVCWQPDGGAHLAVRWQDHKGELVELKSERSRRTVPLAPGMAAELWAAGADRPGDERVFTNSVGGPLQRHNLHNRVLAPARRAAGVSFASFHTFRHTCASLAFDAGRNIAQVSAWLGHADPSFTLRTYVHLMDDGPGDAAFMDAATGAPEPAAAAVAA